MKIERRFTTEETGAYGALAFRTTTSEIRNPDGSVVFSLDNLEVPETWSQVASDVLAQKYFRKAGVPVALKRVKEKGVPSFLWRSVADEAKLADLPEAERTTGETTATPGVRPPRRGLDLLGLEGRLLLLRGRRPRLLRRDALHARDPDGRAELAAVVQHRPALGLRHRRPGAGALLRRLPDRRADPLDLGLRAPAAARLLHPVGRATTSSTTAASWTSGPARRGCSSTARARAPTSPRCAATTSGSPAAAARRA